MRITDNSLVLEYPPTLAYSTLTLENRASTQNKPSPHIHVEKVHPLALTLLI